MFERLDRSRTDVVLIVDDVPDNLSLLHDALDDEGYTVLVATHGEAALQRASQAVPDIILLDAIMPGMDGFEVARRLKAQPETSHIPIIFMTGLSETEHVVAAFAAGSVDYVVKPIRPREVMARIAADEAEILTLAVLPDQRRQGLARILLEEAARQCEAVGAGTLFLEVATRNEAARALYGAQGFEEIGRRRGYYADGDDALVMRRMLTPAPAGPV